MTQHLYKYSRWFHVTPSVLQLTDPTEMRHQVIQGATVMFWKLRDELHQSCRTLLVIFYVWHVNKNNSLIESSSARGIII